MKRFLQWLIERFETKEPPKKFVTRRAGDRRRTPVPRPRPPSARTESPPQVKYGANRHTEIADGGPGKNVLVRKKFVREQTGTHEKLKIMDDSLIDAEDEGGIDPYNTGRFDRAKSWDFPRTRK